MPPGGRPARRASDGGRAARAQAFLERLREIATEHGGRLLSGEYTDDKTKLEFRCREGHTWFAAPTHIKQGKWCPGCARANVIARARGRFDAVVQERGGTLLSKYVDTLIYVRLRCAQGHEWDVAPNSIIYKGKWCPGCAKLSLQDMQAIAAAKGGACLSSTYSNLMTPLRWRCAVGHVWTALPVVVRNGSWCRRCLGGARLDLPLMRRLARQRGGQCLTRGEGRVLSVDALRWRCAEGHEWEAAVTGVQTGSWCPTCAVARRHSTTRLSLQDAHEAAARNGGECRSEVYVNVVAPMQWRCARGHEWDTPLHAVRNGNWCPTCAQRPPFTLEGMHALAKRRGGKCLTGAWIRRRDPLRFLCGEGHEFTATRGAIKTGMWCPHCERPSGADLRRIRAKLPPQAWSTERLTMEDMHALAQRFGGACLSRRYSGVKLPLRWRCARGHAWVARPAEIRSRATWCPVCSLLQPRSLAAVRVLAAQRGGKCVTRKWSDRREPLRLQCAAGHRFDAMLGALKTGVWCPECPPKVWEVDPPAPEPRARKKTRLTIEAMRAWAEGLGGECLSKIYRGSTTKLRWRCARGHEWKTIPGRRRSHWCPTCARLPPHSLADLRALADAREGRCLTRTWDDRSQPLRLECAAGHRFERSSLALKGGLWCPRCPPPE